MLEQVRARILEKLETLTGEGQPLAFAYDYYKKDIEGYPCVMFEPTTVPSEYIDTKYNQRAYNFELLLAHELSNTDRATALNTIIAAFSSILNAFDTDYTLWWLCTGGIDAVPGEFATADNEVGPVLICTIRLVCKTLIDIT